MAGINSPFYDPENGWTPMDQMSPTQLAMMNPTSNMGGYQNPMQMDLISGINNQGTAFANPSPMNPTFDAAPTTYAPYTGPQATPQVDPARNTPMPSPTPQYANSLPAGSESIGGVGMYTGSNGPLDTTRFDPQKALDFVRSIDQNTYYKYVLPFQQAGGDITNQAAIRQAIEQGMQRSGGGQYAVGSQTFNVGGAPTQQPIQQTGPTTPPVAPLPPPQAQVPPQQMQPFNPAAAMGYYQQPQQQNPYSNPYGSQYQPPRLNLTQQNPFQVGVSQYDGNLIFSDGTMTQRGYLGPAGMGGLGPSINAAPGPYTPAMFGGGGIGQQPGMGGYAQPAMSQMGSQQQMQLQQLIANAMARGAMGGQQQPMYGGVQAQGMEYMGSPYAQYMQMTPAQSAYFTQQRQQQMQQQQPQYGYNDLTDYGRQQMGWAPQQQSAPDFRAATFGAGASQSPQGTNQPTGSIASQFSSPSASGSGYNAATPWSNITSNRQPTMGQNYNYLWGGRAR